jgi:hypothetical protein
MHDTAHIAITYWKRVHIYLGTSEGSALNVRQADGFRILFYLSSFGKMIFRTGRFIQKKLQVNQQSVKIERTMSMIEHEIFFSAQVRK